MNRRIIKTMPSKLKYTHETENYIENLKENLPILREFLKEDQSVQSFSNKLEELIIKSLKIDKNNRQKNKIISEQTQNLIRKRTELMFTKNKSKGTREELKNLFKETNRAIKIDYANHRRAIIEKNMTTFRSSKRAFKELSTHKNWIQSLNSEKGEIKNREGIIECATAFYTSLYEKPSHDTTQNNKNDNSINISGEDIAKTAPDPITESEIITQIKQLKPEKSPGNYSLKIKKDNNGFLYSSKPYLCKPNMGLHRTSKEQNFIMPTCYGTKYTETKKNRKTKERGHSQENQTNRRT
ncbi:unnamed protein product [Colias eurytheme]|nr:unnamed protein product [Colias eurytheme]